jgi:hypothetical protein
MKKLLLTLLLIMMITLTSCTHIEDTNGPDNYTVETFTDQDILDGSNSIITVGSFHSHTHINDNLKGSYKVSKLSGILEVYEYDSKASTLNFNISFKCEEGNAMVVIVSNDNIIKKIEANQDIKFEVSNNYKNYTILIVGESAKISLKYEVNSN